jgi:predicted nucleic acid-binding protein
MPAEVFLDASYAVALSSSRDLHHARAVALAERLKQAGTQLLTTRAVVLEIGNALARLRHREAAIRLPEAIESDPQVEIVALSDDLYRQAFDLYRSRPDKEWGLTDCVSFTVMRDRGLVEALTADEHYRQAGLRALLIEEPTP